MKISFFSNISRIGITSNLSAIASILAYEYDIHSLIFENHKNIINIENIMLKRKNNLFLLKEEENIHYINTGIDYIINNLKGEINIENFKDITTPILLNRIDYIKDSKYNMPMFDQKFNEICDVFLKNISNLNMNIFIDTCKRSLTTEKILEYSDIIIMNVSQDPIVIKECIKEYNRYFDKMFFIISMYEYDSYCNYKYIKKILGVNDDRIGVIPYNVEFRESLVQGTVLSFIVKNLSIKNNMYSYDFINELKEIAYKLVE